MLLLQNLVQRGSQVIHVRFVERFVAIECPVLLDEVNDRNITSSINRTEFAIGVLEYRNDCVVLVDEETDVVFLDAAVQADGNPREPFGFIFPDEVLNFGEMLLAMRALGAEIVNEQWTIAELTEHDSRIADSRKVFGKVHFHGLFGLGIHHQLDIGNLRFWCELRKTHCCG